MPRYTIVCVNKVELIGKKSALPHAGAAPTHAVTHISALAEGGARQRFSVGEAAARALLGHDVFFVAGLEGEVEVTAAMGEGGSAGLKALDSDGEDALLRAPQCR